MPRRTRRLAACAVGVLRPLKRRADAHVEHVRTVVERHLHRREQDVGRRRPIAAEDAVGVEPHPGGDAGNRAVGADDARHVRAVSAAVVRERIRGRHRVEARRHWVGIEGVADQVEALRHAAAAAEAAAEIGMVVVDAGIDHRHAHAAAREPELRLGDVGAGHAQGGDQVCDGARPAVRHPAPDTTFVTG